jgi:hypothetical protein
MVSFDRRTPEAIIETDTAIAFIEPNPQAMHVRIKNE